ncbi:myogenesis-regulating glycosidase-like [Rhopalosiphum padi]|uniref:myogenesis-regulating glycosidase-like n=1 Tax=Rhopalosiphum padi TaxID=40932 RepID=UPI00298E6414|nr:myogenesis-regulating glycosidase-like [Rhopalosiphum padi]XP_060841151.1 myogenesis-regulating glycosidase-like [Rhopalosiphum padi]
MSNFLVFYLITLAFSSACLASKNIVLFLDNENKLKGEHGKITTEKSLQLNFYEDCINKDLSVCTPKKKDNGHYLRYFSQSEKPECKNYEQIAQSMNDVLQFCVDMGNSSWYGGAETTFQHWPLNKLNWTDTPYLTRELGSQAVVESYFFNSDGYYIHIDESVPLFVDINGARPGKMCFTAKVVAPYRKDRNSMQYQVCKYKNARVAHESAIKDFLGMPTSIPDPYVIKYPIWSTWARYKADVDTLTVKKFAREIIDHGFPRGTFEIDDKWETCYGSAEFNTSRFKNIKRLVEKLRFNGFKTSLWTHPFVNLECPCHNSAKAKGYFVKSTSNTVNTTWWNGDGSYVDFTNPEAAAWWSNALRNLLATSGIDTLKFDAGESSWSPQLPVFYDSDLTYYPDNIVNAYLKTISSFGNGIEYRASRRSQEFGRLLRMMDRNSRWDFELGLPTLITSLIQLNMIGYPFVLPDMIGGNGYDNLPPSKEMYIRWMQANVFMPVVQFSYTPWDFDQQTVDICRNLMNLRANYTDTIIELMRSSVGKGTPLNPPIWWIDPTDPVAQAIADEFLLGENILVAPVIVQGAKSRDIYLPSGIWRDENHPNSQLIKGRKWLRNYPAKLEVLPWFTRVRAGPHMF